MSVLRSHKDSVFLEMASVLSKLGTCDRKQVGAIIVLDGRAVSWGFNGAPPGLPHCSENRHGWDGWWEMHDTGKRTHAQMEATLAERGCRNATHAEANALAFAARHGISTDGATVYVTLSPCETCARLLIAGGIKRVVWGQTYRDPAGSQLLETAGIEKVVILPGE
jgi:dCMP deaminase